MPARSSPRRTPTRDKRIRIGTAKRRGHNGGKTGESQNIHRVVMKDRHQALRFARTQIFEVDVRNQLAWQIAFAIHAKNLLFELNEAAAFETQFPEPARAMQQIEMAEAPKRRLAPGHAIARFQQRLIVRFCRCR